MAVYREIPCKYYVCKGECQKGKKDAEHNGRCQTCSKYKPRARLHLPNKKKAYNDKMRGRVGDE